MKFYSLLYLEILTRTIQYYSLNLMVGPQMTMCIYPQPVLIAGAIILYQPRSRHQVQQHNATEVIVCISQADRQAFYISSVRFRSTSSFASRPTSGRIGRTASYGISAATHIQS